MTKRTNQPRGGLSPSRGPGRGLVRANASLLVRYQPSRSLGPSRYTSRWRLI
jgi:hypothetical protein